MEYSENPAQPSQRACTIQSMEAKPLQGGLLFSLEDYASFPNAKGRKIRRGPATSRRPHANKRRKNSRKTGRRK